MLEGTWHSLAYSVCDYCSRMDDSSSAEKIVGIYSLDCGSDEDYLYIKQEPEHSIDDVHIKVCSLFSWHIVELLSVLKVLLITIELHSGASVSQPA